MAILQLKRGTTASVASAALAAGELLLDTTLVRLRVGDGTTVGGKPLTVESAPKLTSQRTFLVKLDSTDSSLFDGTANSTPGISGILAITNGGTGGATQADARNNLGAAASGANADITGLSGLTSPSPLPGVINASSAGAGKIGQMIEANASAINLTSGAATTITSISLPAGEWDVYGEVQHVYSATSSSGVVAGIGTAPNADPGFPYKYANYSVNGGTVAQVATPRRFLQLSTATTVYLITVGVFASGTCAAAGYLHARRVR